MEPRSGHVLSLSPQSFPATRPQKSLSRRFEGKTTFGMSVFTSSNAIMGQRHPGPGVCHGQHGILLFLILLVCIALLSSYSIHLLLKCAGVVGIRAYEQLGQRAFGPAGKVVAAVIISIHNIGAMSSYLYIIKYELPLVIKTFLDTEKWFLDGNILIVIVSIFIILPLALIEPHLPTGYLGYTSGLSLTCMVFFLISVIYKKFQIPCPLLITSPDQNSGHYNGSLNSTHLMINISTPKADEAVCTAKIFTVNSQTAYTIPILAFAFVCHPEVLPIYTELRSASKKRMQGVANMSILSMFFMYGLTAIFGYLTFYGKVEAEMLHTYSQVNQKDLLILCVRLAVLMAVTLTVPVVLFPIRRAIQQLLFHQKDFINLLVILIPNIRDIFGVIGATSAPSLIFILPSIFYIRIIPNEKEPLSSRPKMQAACFAALGFIFMIMSLSFIIADWVTTGKSSTGGH
uniref:Solute carrier family 38 member 5 n=1 Tax=Ornithorhynchus anatinus TaxID=9258 RepID=A0A6I8NHR8_ORNAN